MLVHIHSRSCEWPPGCFKADMNRTPKRHSPHNWRFLRHRSFSMRRRTEKHGGDKKPYLLEEVFGKTISWRPKSRASKEKAPGPKQTSAAAITHTNEAASLLWKKSIVGIADQKRMPHALASATKPAPKRVRYPVTTSVPPPTARSAMA